jgi:DNA-binding XRE family transcriptional regulator
MDKHRQLTLTALRQRAGLTQMELALAVEVSQTTISHWEQDQQIPSTKASAVLAVLRAKDRAAVPAGLKPFDLGRPWDEVLIELAAASNGVSKKTSKRHAQRASVGRAARRATA